MNFMINEFFYLIMDKLDEMLQLHVESWVMPQ
jgi:hypothetical protein